MSERPWPITVHPHVRGDHMITFWICTIITGSSPRAWGPLLRKKRAQVPRTVHPHVRGDHDLLVSSGAGYDRFIPTCVGTTRQGTSKPCRCSVHPHVRGDHAICFFFAFAWAGSSPRAWGPRLCRHEQDRTGRFIPTCVGTTVRTQRIPTSMSGSSPRAWGPRGRAVL